MQEMRNGLKHTVNNIRKSQTHICCFCCLPAWCWFGTDVSGVQNVVTRIRGKRGSMHVRRKRCVPNERKLYPRVNAFNNMRLRPRVNAFTQTCSSLEINAFVSRDNSVHLQNKALLSPETNVLICGDKQRQKHKEFICGNKHVFPLRALSPETNVFIFRDRRVYLQR